MPVCRGYVHAAASGANCKFLALFPSIAISMVTMDTSTHAHHLSSVFAVMGTAAQYNLRLQSLLQYGGGTWAGTVGHHWPEDNQVAALSWTHFVDWAFQTCLVSLCMLTTWLGLHCHWVSEQQLGPCQLGRTCSWSKSLWGCREASALGPHHQLTLP